MRHRWIFAPLLALLPLLAACGDGGTGPGESSITGTYTLQRVQGNPLPYVVVQVGNDRVEVTQGQVTLNADQTYSSSFTFRVTEAGQVSTTTQSDAGTYTRNNTAVTLTSTDGSTATGTVNGNTLTIVSQGLALEFQK